MTGHARAERRALADLMAEVGPDAPTLCEGWTVRDLAAHLVLRERRPLAAAGILVPALAPRTARVQDRLKGRDFAGLLAMVRTPPPWSLISNPLLDESFNINEMFVHHEDVRRARPGWSVRSLPAPRQAALYARVRRTARLFLRRLRLTVVLDAPGFGRVRAGAGGPVVTVTGDPGELALFISGRQRVAQVDITGDEAAAARLRRARLGV